MNAQTAQTTALHAKQHRPLAGLLAASVFLVANLAALQQATAQHSLHTVFVAPSVDAVSVRRDLIERLSKSGSVQIVTDPATADAVLRVESVVWPTGTVTVNPRSRSTSTTNYKGYASAELQDQAHQTLWSYLATPSRFRFAAIGDDLAGQLATSLLGVIRGGLAVTAAPGTVSKTTATALHVAGATFPAPLYERWFQSYAQQSGSTQIAYDAIGSSRGLAQLAAGSVDLAASDIPPAAEAPQPSLLRLPTVAGGIVPIYNLPGLDREVRLTPQLLAAIYAGTIRRWNDPRIRSENKSAHLPSAEIVVVHRSDGSGTTFVWTSFLASAADAWKAGASDTVQWPVGIGVAASQGVADKVVATPNSIGYVELTYAIQHRLEYAAVRNPAGRFIKADLDSITAAAGAGGAEGQRSLLNTTAPGAYPIATFTWFLLPTHPDDPQRRAALTAFLRWMLTTGQKECSALGYVPLPRTLVAAELQQLDALK